MTNRRDFLKRTALAACAPLAQAQTRDHVSLSVPETAPAPVKWAAQELHDALTARGVSVSSSQQATFAIAADILKTAGPVERLEILPAAARLAVNGDDRGLIYALLDLADHVRLSPDPIVALRGRKQESGKPANSVRSVTRLFVSEVEDKPWFYDRDMWPAYFTMLATNRFNRFSLAFGIGYDFLREVTDAYFLFPYPFLLSPSRATKSAPAASPMPNATATWRRSASSANRPSRTVSISSWASGCTATNGPTAPRPTMSSKASTTETHGALLPRRADHAAEGRAPRSAA